MSTELAGKLKRLSAASMSIVTPFFFCDMVTQSSQQVRIAVLFVSYQGPLAGLVLRLAMIYGA